MQGKANILWFFVLIFVVFAIFSTKYKQATCDKDREIATE